MDRSWSVEFDTQQRAESERKEIMENYYGGLLDGSTDKPLNLRVVRIVYERGSPPSVKPLTDSIILPTQPNKPSIPIPLDVKKKGTGLAGKKAKGKIERSNVTFVFGKHGDFTVCGCL